ncbi:MAG: hypothetical protein ACRDYA_22315 [Egibacteraceae bacterium]
MTAGRADPGRVALAGGVIVLVTDCCRTRMDLPRDQVDLALTQRVTCRGCQRQRQLDFLSDAREGLRAAWSDPPATRQGARR